MSSLCGILPVDKPAGWTSFDVIAKLRGVLATRKLGHSGTLDPMATGVLPVFVGMAAKAVDLQPDHDKAYRAEVRFGLATDTGDVTGTPVATGENLPDAAAVGRALAAFLGPQMQTPPMCKGTYVRTLVEDLGAALGCPACLAALRRTRAGAFTLESCVTLETIQAAKEAGELEKLLLGVDTVFTHLPAAPVSEAENARLLNGATVRRADLSDGRWRLYAGGAFLGLGKAEGGALRAEKLFVERA